MVARKNHIANVGQISSDTEEFRTKLKAEYSKLREQFSAEFDTLQEKARKLDVPFYGSFESFLSDAIDSVNYDRDYSEPSSSEF